MLFESDIFTSAPEKFSTPLQEKAYRALYNIVGGVNAGTLFVGKCGK